MEIKITNNIYLNRILKYMITNNKITELANQAKHKFKLDFDIKFIQYAEFKKLAKESPIIKQVLDEGFTFSELRIPALIVHHERECIYFCKKIISMLLKNKPKKQQQDFVKAIIYHEIFHILEKTRIGRISFMNCLKQEERVCHDFKKEYPELYKIGKQIHSSATNQSK